MDVNAAKMLESALISGSFEGQNPGPVTNPKTEAQRKELQNVTRRWRGQQVQPHILDENSMTVDNFDKTKSMNRHKRRESYHFPGKFPHGPSNIHQNYSQRWRGQQVQPQNLGTVATNDEPQFMSVAGVPVSVAGKASLSDNQKNATQKKGEIHLNYAAKRTSGSASAQNIAPVA